MHGVRHICAFRPEGSVEEVLPALKNSCSDPLRSVIPDLRASPLYQGGCAPQGFLFSPIAIGYLCCPLACPPPVTKAVYNDSGPKDLNEFGRSYFKDFENSGRLDDLNKATEFLIQAVALTPEGDPAMPSYLTSLGMACRSRYERLGNLDDLNKSIQYTSRAVALSMGGGPATATAFLGLGTAYRSRFTFSGQLDDLEKSIEYTSCAVKLTSMFHPQRPLQLNNLGLLYADRFKRLGELDDAKKSIEHLSCAIELTPKGHPEIPAYLDNLAVPYTDRFVHSGELDDIDKAIEYRYRAVKLLPEGHPAMRRLLGNLGVSHTERYKHLGELDDLEKSIKYKSRADTLTPEDHPDKPRLLTNLGASYKHRFQHPETLDDIDKSIECASRAVQLTPNDHPDMSRRLSFLGSSYLARFDFLPEGRPDDIEKSIQFFSRAIKLSMAPIGHPELLHLYNCLGVAYSRRFQHLGDMDDFEKGAVATGAALAFAPDGQPQLAAQHFNSGFYFLFEYQHLGTTEALDSCLESFRKGCPLLSGPPRDSFRRALIWADLASQYQYLRPLEAYHVAISLLPRFIWLGATADQRYQDLLTANTLAVNASYSAILSSDFSLAIEWLEHTRCVVWSQSLMLRSPVDKLRLSYPTLAAQLETISNQLHASGFEENISQAAISDMVSMEKVGQQRRHLAAEYQHLLVTIRQLAGFEDFLQPMSVNKLLGAAKNGPVVIINCHTDRCDALIVLPQQLDVTHISLPGFNADKAQTARLELQMSLNGVRRGERGAVRRPVFITEVGEKTEFERVLEALWNNIAKPVLDHLGYTSNVPTDNLPHITWCPTGAMTFLPLHAAGDYDKPCSRVFDFAISSYTPTLTALLESTPELPSRDFRVLAVGQAATLPGATLELERLKAHMQGKVEYTQLVDEKATIKAVLDEMEGHDWVHFACHAHQDVGDAKQSGFFLHGGVLDLDAINRRSFKGKGLAFLSACQTATGDKELPDEAVHLASAMLMAGYTSVIATMWSVEDEDAPFVADKVYNQLMIKRRLGNGEAGKALHHAVAGLREQVGEKEFWRWVPYIHIGS